MKIMTRWAAPILCSLFSLYVLMGLLPEYGLESARNTPFYTNSLFLHQSLSARMGVFILPSSALMSTFAHPWLGAVLTTLLILLLGVAIERSLGLPAAWSPVAYIPGILTMIPYVSEGYNLYLCKCHGSEFQWLFLLLAIFLVLWLLRLVVSRFAHLPKWRDGGRWAFALSIVMLGAALYATYTQVCRDKTLSVILRMKHQVQDNDWSALIEESQRNSEEPTRLQVMFTRLALHKQGAAGYATYSFRDGDAPYNAEVPNQYLRLIGGSLIYYHYGRLQFAYRWAMEHMIEYGMRPEYLEMMLKVSLLTGEKSLARKYADQLSHSPLYRGLAEHYRPYIDNSELIRQDDEMASILPLVDDKDILDGDGGRVEAYLLQSFATQRGGNAQQEEVALDCAMVQKSIPDFWPHFANLALQWQREGKEIPRHYQEAALLFAQLQGNVSLEGLAIDPAISSRFSQLVEASSQNSGMSDEYNAQVLKGDYGDTYWYYFFFTKGLKTN